VVVLLVQPTRVVVAVAVEIHLVVLLVVQG
jgi:hypothetical protein